MKLTIRQRFQLNLYMRFRNRDMSVGELFWLNRKIYVLLTLWAVLTTFAVFFAFGPIPASIVIVWYVALILRDVSQFIRSRHVWPVHRDLLDWVGIERLLREDASFNQK